MKQALTETYWEIWTFGKRSSITKSIQLNWQLALVILIVAWCNGLTSKAFRRRGSPVVRVLYRLGLHVQVRAQVASCGA